VSAHRLYILPCISAPSMTPFLEFIISPWVCGFIVSLQIEAYMLWYRDERIKLSLGGLSPAEFRSKMGIAI
ncbi:IS3 family transposase, partial [Candidatus Agathobaculum pullicola]|uniref:IS3 family transposase n=1 Tax=Candidatus Agathobaculum pullicola TaxID=2838426 RepID=UPI003F8F38F2